MHIGIHIFKWKLHFMKIFFSWHQGVKHLVLMGFKVDNL